MAPGIASIASIAANGGIFPGMNDKVFPTRDEVLNQLGDGFVRAYLEALGVARAHYASFRSGPDFPANPTQRMVACFIHDWIWSAFVPLVEGDPSISVHDREPERQLTNGTNIRIRIKRHQLDDSMSSYPTEGSRDFWTPAAAVALDGLEEVPLALGYRWDSDERAVGDAVLTLRDGADKAVWAAVLTPASDSARGFSAREAPETPTWDLSAVVAQIREEQGS